MKQRLITLLIVLAATATGAWAVKDKTVEIGIEQGGTELTTILPIYTYRTYHMSQQIYTSEEIGIPQGGKLKSISLYYDHSNQSYALERSTNLTIKLANTEVESLQGDYPKTTQSKKWVTGGTTYTFSNFSLPATSGWITITFNNPFTYNGKNLAIMVYSEMKNDYQYGRFRSYNCGKYQSLYVNYDIEWQDNNYSATSHTFNPNTPTKYTGRPVTSKNQIKMVITPNPGLSFSDVVAPELVVSGQPFTMSANVTNIDEEEASPETTAYVEASADGSTWQTIGQQPLAVIAGGATTPVAIENATAHLDNPVPENIQLRLRVDAFGKSFYSTVKSVPYLNLYDGKLGNEYSPEMTVFKVWNPTATSVKVNRYATGTDGEADAQNYGSTEMNKLMDGSNWTGVWTCTIAGDLKGSYYTYSANEEEIADPWSQAVGFDRKRSMVFNVWDVAADGWDSDYHVFYEPGKKIEYIDVPTFSEDPMCGVSDSHRGKYLALTEDNTTYENAGLEPTCMSKLKAEGCKAVIVTMTDPQMVVDPYSTNPYDGTTVINEVQQAIMAVHKTFGMSFFVRFDFSTIPVNEVFRRRYITETIQYWVETYHVDGIVLASDIDTETRGLIRDLLDGYDSRIVLTTDDETTGISNAIVEKKSADNWYTLDGKKVAQPSKKGIYISDGRKILIK